MEILLRPPRPRPEPWILFKVQCEDTEVSYDQFHESHGPLCLIPVADLKRAEKGKCSAPRPSLFCVLMEQFRGCGQKRNGLFADGEACQLSHKDSKPTEAAREVEQSSLALVAVLTSVPSRGEVA